MRFFKRMKDKQKKDRLTVGGETNYVLIQGRLRCENYRMPESVEMLRAELPKEVDKCIDLAKVDEFNKGTCLDAYIDLSIQRAKDQLLVQQQRHQEVIAQILRVEEAECRQLQREYNELYSYLTDKTLIGEREERAYDEYSENDR